MDILISEDVVGPAIDGLRQRFDVVQDDDLHADVEALYKQVAGARALIVRNRTQVTENVLAAAKQLHVVGRAGVGLDNIDVDACSRDGVVVVFTPEENATSVAEMAMAMILALSHKLPAADRHVRQGGWDRRAFWGTDLAGKTLGLLGLGKIGFRVALRAAAFGMRIVAYDPFLNPNAANVTESGADLLSLEDVLADSDFVSCHLPSTPTTRGMLNAETLGLMKPTAFFVNTSRGDVVVEADLAALLSAGKLAGAGLDVRQVEPPPADSPLHSMDNVLFTPHVAGLSHEAQDRVTTTVAEDVARILDGAAARSYVNFPRPMRAD